MYSAQNFIDSYRKETKICINLFSHLPAGGLDFRPTPGQRTTLELMRYLAYGPVGGVKRIIAGDWNIAIPAAAHAKEMPASDFVRQMTIQADEVETLVHSVPMSDLTEKTMTFPWGETALRGPSLVNYPLKWITGYRMQFFLYLKAAGAHHLTTGENWRHPAGL